MKQFYCKLHNAIIKKQNTVIINYLYSILIKSQINGATVKQKIKQTT